MVLKIISEGGVAARGTKIIDTETGDDLTKKLAVELGSAIELDELVTLKARIALVECEVEAGKVIWKTKNPISGKYEALTSMQFADGTFLMFRPDGEVIIHHPDERPAPLLSA